MNRGSLVLTSLPARSLFIFTPLREVGGAAALFVMILPLLRRPCGAFANAGRRTLTLKAPAGACQAVPVVIHGKRSIREGMVQEFHRHYDAYSKEMSGLPGIKAVYAFADKEDPLSFHHVIFARDAASFDSARARIAETEAAVRLAYTAPNDDDTLVLPRHVTAVCDAADSRLVSTNPVLAMAEKTRSYTPDTLNVYGSWSDAAAFWIDPSVRHVLRPRLAGYIRAGGAGQPGPPLLGFTRRHVKPGHMEELGASFQRVCDLWHERVPGILAASVHREPERPNVVHDLRIFANHEASQAHAVVVVGL